MAAAPFKIDGVSYAVYVTSLTRKFSVSDTEKSGRTTDGEMYRDIIGTFYNYSMTLAAQSGHDSDLDALWEVLSKPVESHVCTFPYGQKTITQRMYVSSGEQSMERMTERLNRWGEIKLSFVAMSPKVVPQ